MREVLEVGGACRSEYGVPCPDGVAVAIPMSVPGLISGGAVYSLASRGRGGMAAMLVLWSLLFGALGFNFLDFGMRGDHINIAFLSCAILFGLFALTPLVLEMTRRVITLRAVSNPRSLPVTVGAHRIVVHLLDAAATVLGVWCGQTCWNSLSL
ncbi:DUF2637 domain-containing protein [Streptomyces sp. NPDC002659]|uniref:DUF2637 domain-containing protein n=1 Tax=Streptomyces sp. NPDC002659 TaxID=3364656 RepID=UPI0036AB6938